MISIILFVCFVCSLILFAIVMYNTEYEYEDEPIMSEHTDRGKTKELYITIDGKEYHFEFKEEK